MIPGLEGLRARLYASILDARRDEAAAILASGAAVSGYPLAIAQILEPTLRLIGERWSLDRISLAQAYVAGKVAEDVLHELESGDARLAEDKGIAVIGNAEDDFHALGRRMVGAFLRIEGWKVVDLGNDVLASTFLEAAESSGARILGVSAMMLTNARNIRKLREEMDRRGLSAGMRLAVGGAVFALRPELVREVGGDGTAATAMDAPALFERLSAELGGSRA